MREFSLDLDKITKTIFFCKKVFVSTCLRCFNAATPLLSIARSNNDGHRFVKVDQIEQMKNTNTSEKRQ
jgi:hypothetical protein